MLGWLSIVALFLLFYIVFKIAKTSELASILKGDPFNTEYASKVNGTLLMVFLILGIIGIVWSSYEFIPLMLPEAASVHGVETDGLFNLTLFFTGLVFIITQIVLFWFAYKYREKKGRKAFFYSHNNKLEIIWTVVPAVVMTVLVVMGMRTWFDIFPAREDMAKDRLEIEVTAKQFNWTVRYAGMDGTFGKREISKSNISPTNELGIVWSDKNSHDDIMPKEIHLIKDRPVLVKLGALDVLHSFYLPHFRVKMDCVPGTPTSFYFTPTITTAEMKEKLKDKRGWQKIDPETGEPKWKNFKYELACSELCGKSHYAMQMDVIVETQEEFNAWAESQKPYYELVVKPSQSAAAEDISPMEQIENQEETTETAELVE